MSLHKKNTMPTSFSGFAWAIGGFCFPITFYPLAIFLSTNFDENPHLSTFAIRAMTIFFWAYPLYLGGISLFCHRLYQRHSQSAKRILAIAWVLFYFLLFLCFKIGLIYQI